MTQLRTATWHHMPTKSRRPFHEAYELEVPHLKPYRFVIGQCRADLGWNCTEMETGYSMGKKEFHSKEMAENYYGRRLASVTVEEIKGLVEGVIL